MAGLKADRQIQLMRFYTIGLSSLFILPVLVPYYRDVIGLDFQGFLLGEAVFSAFVIIGEIPTGYLSDIWRRKNVLLLGILNGIIGYVVLLLARDLWMALLAQVFIGTGLALVSGTAHALLYDYLYERQKQEAYRRWAGHLHGLGLFFAAFAGIVGAGLYQISPFLPLCVDIVFMAIAMWAVALMVEPGRHKKGICSNPLKDMAQTVHYAMRGHADIAGIILFSAFLFSGTKIFLWAQQPYYIALGLPEYSFGLLMASGALLGAIGGQYGHYMDRFFSNRNFLTICLLTLIFAAIFSGFSIGFHGIFLLMTGTLIYGLAFPYVQHAINIRVSSERRATILSTLSLMIHLVFIPLSAFLGMIHSKYGIGAVLFSLAAIVGGVALTARLWLWHARKEKSYDSL